MWSSDSHIDCLSANAYIHVNTMNTTVCKIQMYIMSSSECTPQPPTLNVNFQAPKRSQL